MVGRKWKTGLVKSKKDMMTSFLRRKQGILKKAHELSVLCGVSVAVVIFGPDKEAPHVWPQCLEGLHSIIGKYLNMSPDQRNKSNRTMKMSDFIKKDLELEEGLSDEEDEEQEETVDEKEVGKDTCWVDDNIDGFSVEQLVDLVGNLDAKLDMVDSRIDMLKRVRQNPGEVGYILPCDQGQEMMTNMQYEGMLKRVPQNPLEVGYILPCDQGQEMVNNMQYEEMPLPLNFDSHNHFCSGGNCNPMIGNFVDRNAGMMGIQEMAQSSSWYSRLAPWEKMLM